MAHSKIVEMVTTTYSWTWASSRGWYNDGNQAAVDSPAETSRARHCRHHRNRRRQQHHQDLDAALPAYAARTFVCTCGFKHNLTKNQRSDAWAKWHWAILQCSYDAVWDFEGVQQATDDQCVSIVEAMGNRIGGDACFYMWCIGLSINCTTLPCSIRCCKSTANTMGNNLPWTDQQGAHNTQQ